MIRLIERYKMASYHVNSVALFVCCSSSHSKIFHSYGDVTITGEGLQILTKAWHSWPLSSEGSLECHMVLWHGASV